MNQSFKVANPARGQLNREYFSFLSLLAPENLVLQDRFGRSVSRQPAHSPHGAECGADSRDSPHFPQRLTTVT